MPTWSPFTKLLSDLAEDDLLQLKGKSEASWLEYKRDTNNEDLAKIVAAFANGHGGWFFLGIDAPNNNEPELRAAGVDPGDWQGNRIRHVVNSALSSIPDVQTKQVQVADGRVVFAIAVDEGVDPPYIRRSDGRIYVRQGEESRPIDYVRDRHELDALYDRSEKYRHRVDELLKAEGHGEVLPALHHSDLRKAGAAAPLWLSLLLVPISGAFGRFGAGWVDDQDALHRLWVAALDRVPRAQVAQPWQHGRALPPEYVGGGKGETAAVGLAKHGILELSVALPGDRFLRGTLISPLGDFLCMACVIYWKHQYDGRMRVEAALRDGEHVIRASRMVSLPPAVGCTPWHLAQKQQSAQAWAQANAQDLLDELVVGVETDRRIRP